MEILLAAFLTAGIIAVLLVPSRPQVAPFGSTARHLFTLTEGDYISPVLSSPKEVTMLNCAADDVAQFAGYDDFSGRVNIDQRAEIARITRFNGNLFSILNIRFELAEPLSSRQPVVYISEAFWVRAFGRNERILGTLLPLHNVTYRIAGVTSRSFGLLANTDIWLPVSGRGSIGTMSSMKIVGLLHAGSDWAAAQSKVFRCSNELLGNYPFYNLPLEAKLLPLEAAVSFRDTIPSIVAAINTGTARSHGSSFHAFSPFSP